MLIVKKFFFLVIGLLISQSMHTVIVRGEIWRKQKDDGSYYYVYAMYDLHVGCLMAEPNLGSKIDFKKLIDFSDNQYQILLKNLKKLPQKNVMTLVEDSYTDRAGNPILPESISQMLSKIAKTDKKIDLLQGLVSRFKQAGVTSVTNIDYRHKRMASVTYDGLIWKAFGMEFQVSSPSMLAMMGNEATQENNRLRSAGLTLDNIKNNESILNFKMQDIAGDIENMISTVQGYTDNQLLFDYYAGQIQSIRSQGQKTYSLVLAAREKKFNEFLRGFADKEPRFAIAFLLYGATLLEMKALHEIYQNMNTKEKMFLIAGGAHVYSIVSTLQRLGYERVYETGADLSRHSIITNPMYDLDSIMAMSYADYSTFTMEQSSKTAQLIMPIFTKKTVFNPKFFDLMLSDDPQEGWALGHGPIQ
jgi:hypothetical protein